MFWKKKSLQTISYDNENWKPILKCSICNGEMVAGFRHLHTGEFKEECMIRGEKELQEFKAKYGIVGEVEKVY